MSEMKGLVITGNPRESVALQMISRVGADKLNPDEIIVQIQDNLTEVFPKISILDLPFYSLVLENIATALKGSMRPAQEQQYEALKAHTIVRTTEFRGGKSDE